MSITTERRLELQMEGLAALMKQKEPKFTETFFPYTSGQIGPYYIQSIVVENDGTDYAMAIAALAELIKEDTILDENDVISGGESRDWDFSNPVAVLLGMPHAKIYKNSKILGADVKGKRVIHIGDLNNEGSSMRDLWVPAVNAAGGNIDRAFFYVDRMEDGVDVLREMGIPSHSVVPLDANAWQFLKDQRYISSELYTSLNDRGATKETRQAWAENMLRSQAGLEELARLLTHQDMDTVFKGIKVMELGYPHMLDELKSALPDGAYVRAKTRISMSRTGGM